MTSEALDTRAVRRWKRYAEYQPASMVWLPRLPGHWGAKRLKYLAVASRNRLFEKPNDATYIGLEQIESRTGKLLLDRPVDTVESAMGAFKRGDVLFGKLRPYLAKVAAPAFSGVCTTELIVYRPNAHIEGEYLKYQMLVGDFTDFVNARAYGTKMPRVSEEQIGEIALAVPPLPEQRAIAAFLDRETARIDELIGCKERLIALLEEKRQAVISHAVTRGLDPAAPLKDSGVAWIGMVPKHWTLLALKRLARTGYKTITDGDWIESPYITDEGVRLIQTGNIGAGVYKEQGHRFVSDDTCREFKCTTVDPGDVLICRLDGPVGRACLAPDLGCRMIASVDVTILKPARSCDARYIVYLLTVPAYLQWVESLCRVGGGHRWRVSRTMLGDFTVPMPPKGEQTAIADHLDDHTRKLGQAVQVLQRHISMMSEYRTALISAAVTGQIDVRGEV